MIALEGSVREILYGSRLQGAEGFHLTEVDLARVVRIEELSREWMSAAKPPPELVTLADDCVRALCGGASWRELVAASGAPASMPMRSEE
jgi:hypothetical protein